MSNIAHASLLDPNYELVENAIVGYIMHSDEIESAIYAVLEDDGLWDDHYGKYEDEWHRFEEEWKNEHPDEEYINYDEEYTNILSAVFERNNGHVYLYPYEIAYKFAGDWSVLLDLPGIEDMTDKEIVREFLKLGRNLKQVCVDYLSEEIMKTHTGYW